MSEWVISGQAFLRRRAPMSALIQKRTNYCDAAIVHFVPQADNGHQRHR
jgi:hypothetical protein